jgi:hypothetical protein
MPARDNFETRDGRHFHHLDTPNRPADSETVLIPPGKKWL